MTPGSPVIIMVRLDGIAYLTGEIVEITPTEILLAKVTWHRETGRHGEFLAGAPSKEREQYPPAMIVALRRADCPLIAGPWAGDLLAGSL
jgi:hypothetical protein